MRALLRHLLSLFQPSPKDERTPEERARVDRAWDDVFARLEIRRKERAQTNH
jgi:hypothetical protein